MRLHSLTMSAFGPFAGTESVDFDALNDAGIFLFTGPTGAGKTSVLDAVCFAIFGEVPGSRGQANRLRSDHAEVELRTSVELELTVRGRRLRFTRSPGWDRPKKRGVGTTREQPSVLVQELGLPELDDAAGGPTQVVATRLDEVGLFVKQVFGMTATQFCQTVLLPQGQFADFLRAGAEERRSLLEQLFATGRFSTAESYLVDLRRERWQRFEHERIELAALLARIAQAAGIATARIPESTGEADEPAELQGWLSSLLAEALSEADAAREAERHAAGATKTARALKEKADALAAKQAQHATAANTGLLLAEQSTAVAELRERLTRAERLLPLRPLVVEVERVDSEASLSGETAVAARRLLPAELREAPATELRAEAERLTGRRAVLTDLLAEEARLTGLVEQQTMSTESLAGSEKQVAKLGQLLAALPEREAVAAAQLATASEAARRLPEQRSAATEARRQAAAALDRDRLTSEVAQAEADELAANHRYATVRTDWLDLRQARLEGMSAELARNLRRGEPCGVCGATEHPSPAPTTSAVVTAQAERRAEALAVTAEQEHRSSKGRLDALSAALAGVLERAGAEPTLDLVTAAESAEALAAATEKVAITVAAHELTCATLREEKGRLDEQAAAAEIERATATERLRQAKDEVTRLEGRIARVAGSSGPLAPAIDSLVDRCSRLTEAATAADADSAAVLLRDAARTRLIESMTAAGLLPDSGSDAAEHGAEHDAASETISAVMVEAAMSEPDLSHGWATVTEFEELYRDTNRTLAEAELVAAAAEPPAVPRASSALTDAETVQTLASVHRGAMTSKAMSLETLALELSAILDRIAPLREQYRSAASLSRLTEGAGADNALRMRLSAYVLAARLEQVAEAANVRLADMTGSRYTLAHTDASGSGRGKAGLGLRVLDSWTGAERDPGTLSGGETFMASLALALGLADVATAEAGGILLDTLLVDEGFGSLDDESLEEVLDALDSLRHGGRVVGVVSHVADLRARIPAQVRVRKSNSGSRLSQTLGSAAATPGTLSTGPALAGPETVRPAAVASQAVTPSVKRPATRKAAASSGAAERSTTKPVEDDGFLFTLDQSIGRSA